MGMLPEREVSIFLKNKNNQFHSNLFQEKLHKIQLCIFFTITNDRTKYHDVDWVFAFHHYRYILWGKSKPRVVL